MDSASEGRPPTTPEQHHSGKFRYTLVFGQGPVQEKLGVPETGRKGLNFFSRMTAMAAAQMLKGGITEKVILSGGKTGARKETPEGKTEAELMADVIRRHLIHTTSDRTHILANNHAIPLMNADATERPRAEIDRDIVRAFDDVILIENEAKDSLENFAKIINKYGSQLESTPNAQPDIALLGIGFHAHDTFSGAGAGRLEVLADIFGLGKSVYSAEEVLQNRIVNHPAHGSFVQNEMGRLVETAHSHDVAKQKSRQEEELVYMLKKGDWIRIVKTIENPERVMQAVRNDPYVIEQLQKQCNLTRDQIDTITFDDLLMRLSELKNEAAQQLIEKGADSTKYGQVKTSVFEALSRMTNATGIDYLGMYGKGELPKPVTSS
jgi:hypothetical protein